MNPEHLTIMQASMQVQDSPAQWREDALQLFQIAVREDVDVIGFTETTNRREPAVFEQVRDAAGDAGFWLQTRTAGPGDGRFAVNPKHKILESGYVHVVDPDGHRSGQPGAHSAKGIAEVTFETPAGNVVSSHVTHWLTHYQLDREPGAEGERERDFTRQTKTMIERVKLHGAGRRLSFWQGDTNLNEERDTGFDKDAIEARFSRAGLESVFDELYGKGVELPPTHGPHGSTLDIIGHCVGDGRVKAAGVRVIRRGRHSDHALVIADYDIAGTKPKGAKA